MICPTRNVDGDTWLTAAQKDDVAGIASVHEPIEAYEEKWEHVESRDEDGSMNVLAFPVEGTRKKKDLPSLAAQWRADAKRRGLPRETSNG